MTAPTFLDSLPPEILQNISQYLDEAYPPSVQAFACVNTTLYSAATPLLFRTIQISVSCRDDLPQDILKGVQKYIRRLQHAASFRHVRHLVINDDYTRFSISATERGRGGPFDGYLDQLGCSELMADNLPPESVYEINDAWKPLADLIKQLPSLTDLLYSCASQFPPCLLETLHASLPQCRLHLNTFRLHSLSALQIDSYELKLLMSPCLHSVRAAYDELEGFDSDDVSDHHGEAILWAVGLAPNIKETHSYHLTTAAHVPNERSWLLRNIQEKGEHCGLSIGSLQYLHLFDYLPISKQTMKEWEAHTDFSLLQTLKLETFVGKDALDHLTINTNFSSLTSLALNFRPEYDQRHHTFDYYESARHFLHRLPPLSTLTLRYWHHDLSLDFLPDHHGSHLRELTISPSVDQHLTSKVVSLITESCPLLENLTIIIPRSQGDTTEVTFYRALSSLPRLQYLDLTLDASDPAVSIYHDAIEAFNPDDPDGPDPPNDPAFDDFDQDICEGTKQWYRFPQNGHIRHALANGALDESLACAIFRIIARKTTGSLPLKRMTVRVKGAGNFTTLRSRGNFEEVMQHLARAWRVEWNPRDDSDDDLLAREVEIDIAQRKDWCFGKMEPWLGRIFRRIWPGKDGGSDWWEDWYGLPLATEDV